jgi:hypothetical protein
MMYLPKCWVPPHSRSHPNSWFLTLLSHQNVALGVVRLGAEGIELCSGPRFVFQSRIFKFRSAEPKKTTDWKIYRVEEIRSSEGMRILVRSTHFAWEHQELWILICPILVTRSARRMQNTIVWAYLPSLTSLGRILSLWFVRLCGVTIRRSDEHNVGGSNSCYSRVSKSKLNGSNKVIVL